MIICAGESLIDMVSSSEQKGEAQYTPHVGGSILNSARALGRLEADTYYCGAVSNDTFGGLILDCLRDSKVQEDFIINTNRPTTLAYADVTDGVAKYTFVDEHSAGRLIDKDTLKPVHNAIVWQCRRSAAICDALKQEGLEDEFIYKVRVNTHILAAWQFYYYYF